MSTTVEKAELEVGKYYIIQTDKAYYDRCKVVIFNSETIMVAYKKEKKIGRESTWVDVTDIFHPFDIEMYREFKNEN